MPDVTTFTTISFGYTIAYLIPGSAALYAVLLASNPHNGGLQAIGSNSGIVVLFVLFLAALAVGLIVGSLRWFLFEQVLLFRKRLKRDLFAAAAVPGKYTVLRLLIDEAYRYHQCCGGLAIVFPYLAIEVISRYHRSVSSGWLQVGMVAVEAVLIFNAIWLYVKYSERASALVDSQTPVVTAE
jgi:hypothetical protein